MILSARLRRIGDELGATGLVAVGLLAGAGLFFFLVLKPAEARNEALELQLSARAPRGASGPGLSRASSPAAKLAAFYRLLETDEQTTERLARLHAIGKEAGVDLRSADYRLQRAGTRIERYEIALRLAGTYTQIRTFLATALLQMPALSLDQVSFKRQSASEALVQADVFLSLHRVPS
jgi:hypothetical protein